MELLELPDHDLVELITKGEFGNAAITELMKRHSAGIAHAASFHSFPDIEDILQSVWLRCWKMIKSFRFESTILTWLYTIGRNAAIDLSKKAFRTETLLRLDGEGTTVEQLLIFRHSGDYVAATLLSKDEEHRDVSYQRGVPRAYDPLRLGFSPRRRMGRVFTTARRALFYEVLCYIVESQIKTAAQPRLNPSNQYIEHLEAYAYNGE
ncbi:MAG: sigma-70 family RNA polymerase sigma factor [Corynebacterium sp.]|nr:sigma-70 family RNA polymerase sigma factor [Corynebacterium sp.]